MKKSKFIGHITTVLAAGRDILDKTQQPTDNLGTQRMFGPAGRPLRQLPLDAQHVHKERSQDIVLSSDFPGHRVSPLGQRDASIGLVVRKSFIPQ